MGRWLVVALLAGCGSHAGASGAIDGASDAPVIGDGSYADVAAIEHTIRVTLDERPDHPQAFSFVVAFRDGGGAWQPAGTPDGDTYSFETFSPTWSVAWTCSGAESTTAGQSRWIASVAVAEFTAAERTSVAIDIPPRCTDRMPPVITMTGAIANTPAGTGGLYLNLLDQYTTGDQAYSLRARLGAHDLLVRKLDQKKDSSTFATLATFVERDLSVGSLRHDLDLATAAPTQAFDVAVPAGTNALATTLLYTKSGTTVTLGRTSAPLQTFGLDASQVRQTDVYDQQVELDEGGQTALVTTATSAPGPLTVQPPSPLGSARASVVGETPYPMLQTTWPTYSDAVGYTWTATQTVGLPEDCIYAHCPLVTWTALVSPGVAGGSPSYRMPDLSGLPGWNPQLGFQEGFGIVGYAEADTSSAGASDFPASTPPAAGTQRTFVRSGFTLLP